MHMYVVHSTGAYEQIHVYKYVCMYIFVCTGTHAPVRVHKYACTGVQYVRTVTCIPTYVPPPADPLWLIRDSSSSRKMVDGAWNLANSNSTW